MAEPQTRENLAQNPSLSPLSRSSFAAAAAVVSDPDPGDHPLAPPAVSVTTAADSSDVGIEDPDLIREPKRRKHCPTALENLDELTSASNSSFAFTFDTKFCGFSAEITPKFGSFNSISPEIERKKKDQITVLDLASERRGDEEEEEKGDSVQREEEEEIGVADALLEAIGGGGVESVAD